MLKRKAKNLFYLTAAPFMHISGLLCRHFFKAPLNAKVHLGPGQNNYLKNWINVDANVFTGKCDVWADLRNPLPFRDNSLKCCYSHHVIEHLPDIYSHFKDVFRCLSPGGVYRLAGPNGDNAIYKFSQNHHGWFSDFPESRSSIGGRLENFIFCRGEHLTLLTFSYLEELLLSCGFEEPRACLPVVDTQYSELFADCLKKEHENDFDFPHTLVIEARKPLVHPAKHRGGVNVSSMR